MAKKVEVDVKLLIVAVAFLIIATVGSAFVTFLIFRGSGDQAQPDMVVNGTVIRREIGPTYEVGDFTLNLASVSGQSRFVKVDIVLELKDKKTVAEMEKRQPQIRDQIISLIRGRTAEQLRSEAGLELLRADIISNLNNLLLKGEVLNVFFQDLMIQ